MIKPIPEADMGKPFTTVWQGIEYTGRVYRPGDVIAIDRYVTVLAERSLQYHFHDFHSPTDSFNLLDSIHNGRVTQHLTIIETRQPYTPIHVLN